MVVFGKSYVDTPYGFINSDRTGIGGHSTCYTNTNLVLNYRFDKPITTVTYPAGEITNPRTGEVVNTWPETTQTFSDYVILNYDLTIVRSCECLDYTPVDDCDSFDEFFKFGTDYGWDCTRYNFCGLMCDSPDVCPCTLNEGALEFFRGVVSVTKTAGLNEAQIQDACDKTLLRLVGPDSSHFRCSCDC